VPLIFKNPVTGACNAFPTRRGYTDAAACVSEDGGEPAWVAATFTTQGFLWFALKNANDFPLTLLWMANHGRHASPWYGRENWLGARRHPRILRRGLARIGRTKFSLGRRGADRVYGDAAKPVRLNYIQGVVATPAGFGRATRTVFEPGGVRFINGNGAEARALVNHAFLRDMASPAAARDREGPVPPA
jgi:hypothetical protein